MGVVILDNADVMKKLNNGGEPIDDDLVVFKFLSVIISLYKKNNNFNF